MTDHARSYNLLVLTKITCKKRFLRKFCNEVSSKSDQLDLARFSKKKYQIKCLKMNSKMTINCTRRINSSVF